MQFKVANTDELKSGEAKTVYVNGKQLALFNVNGKFFCLDNQCAHQGGPLGEGFLEDYVVTCPWHGARYDVRTGKLLTQFPPSQNMETHKVTVKGQEIFVDI